MCLAVAAAWRVQVAVALREAEAAARAAADAEEELAEGVEWDSLLPRTRSDRRRAIRVRLRWCCA